uniref:Hemicentin-2 isoform X2 n=1 Tax=Hirondellea gigas TaxID=1518452 RepID=A0A6A7G5P3_9CRUS
MAASHVAIICSCVVMGIISTTQGGVAYDPEASITGLYTGPYFDPLAPRNLTAHLGDRAELPCTVRQLGDKSVSWVRMRDADILTVDRYTFVGDERFEAQYSIPAETWNLIINYVQERDAGDYECQVSTEPKMSQFFNLRVVVPQVNIEPPGDRHVKSGSKVRIDCHITDVVQIPDYIFWYHDNVRVLDRTDPNLDVTVTRTGEESIMSSLYIERVRKDQSGNYTCMPSNLHAAFTLLHVLNEEHPAAMQDGRNVSAPLRLNIQLLALIFSILIIARLSQDCTNYYSQHPGTTKQTGSNTSIVNSVAENNKSNECDNDAIVDTNKLDSRAQSTRQSATDDSCSNCNAVMVNDLENSNNFLSVTKNEKFLKRYKNIINVITIIVSPKKIPHVDGNGNTAFYNDNFNTANLNLNNITRRRHNSEHSHLDTPKQHYIPNYSVGLPLVSKMTGRSELSPSATTARFFIEKQETQPTPTTPFAPYEERNAGHIHGNTSIKQSHALHQSRGAITS